MKTPTVEQIAAYAAELGLKGFDAEAMHDHYECNGWVVGRARAPMKSWQAAVRQWHRRSRQWASEQGRGPAVDETAVKAYAIQLRRMRAGVPDAAAIGRFKRKVIDTIGLAGWKRVEEMA